MNQTILLVSADNEPATKNVNYLRHYLSKKPYTVNQCQLLTHAIQHSILILNPDSVIIYCEKTTQPLIEMINAIQNKTPKPLIIYTKYCNDNMIADSIIAGASAFIVDGVKRHDIHSVIEVSITRFNKCQAAQQPYNKTSSVYKERRTIDHAKGLLMKTKGISEDKAYQYLRKMAMDKNQRISKISQALLNTIETHQKCA